MPALLTAADLSTILGEQVDPARFEVLHRITVGAIRGEYRRDPLLAVGRDAEVLHSVAVSVLTRLTTNPSGVRSGGLGSASVTFGGSDEEIASGPVLTDAERETLRSLRGRRAVSVSLRTWQDETL